MWSVCDRPIYKHKPKGEKPTVGNPPFGGEPKGEKQLSESMPETLSENPITERRKTDGRFFACNNNKDLNKKEKDNKQGSVVENSFLNDEICSLAGVFGVKDEFIMRCMEKYDVSLEQIRSIFNHARSEGALSIEGYSIGCLRNGFNPGAGTAKQEYRYTGNRNLTAEEKAADRKRQDEALCIVQREEESKRLSLQEQAEMLRRGG